MICHECYFGSSVEANGGRAFEVSIVVVYNSVLNDLFKGLTAKQFFEKKEQLKRENAGVIDIIDCHLIPGTANDKLVIYSRPNQKPLDCIIFASYPTVKTENITRKTFIGDKKEISLLFDKNGVQIISNKNV